MPTTLSRSPPHADRRAPRPWLWLVAAVLLVPIGWLTMKFLLLKTEPEVRHKVAQITLVRPPPPPPRTPEKPPEPPKLKDEVKIDPPQPVDQPKPAQQTDAPPPGPLGVDAQGTGPGDGFGLAGRPGGRDITIGGGGGGLSNTLFANQVARQIAQELGRLGDLRNVEYRVDLRIWLTRDGRIERCEVARGSGDSGIDRMVADGVLRIGALRQNLPDNLALPLRIRVTSADA